MKTYRAAIIAVALILLSSVAVAPNVQELDKKVVEATAQTLQNQFSTGATVDKITIDKGNGGEDATPNEMMRQGLVIQNEDFNILLKVRKFVPEKKLSTSLKAKLDKMAAAEPSARTHVLMQFERIPALEEREELKREGVDLLAYVPNNAWYVSLPAGKANQISAKSLVRAIDVIKPEYKISPYIQEGKIGKWAIDGNGDIIIIVSFHSDVPIKLAEEEIREKYSLVVQDRIELINALTISIPQESILQLAGEDSVEWIEPISPPIAPTLVDARPAIYADVAQAAPYYLSGAGVTAFVAEAGGLVDNTHSCLKLPRVTRDIDSGVSNDHATNVAGIIGARGACSFVDTNGTEHDFRGIAPSVNIYSDSIGNPSYYSSGDVQTEYDKAINQHGVDVANNSWDTNITANCPGALCFASCSWAGDYTFTTQLFDNIVRGSLGKNLPVVFAVGNERSSGFCGTNPSNPNDNYETIAPPSTAKNVISVGAVNSIDDSMTGFSNWGPTDDLRIKPDVVAPGCGGDFALLPGFVIVYDPDADNAIGACGTSQAAPMVTGSIALMTQQYRQLHGSDPSPSLLKALLIHTAKDLDNLGPDYQNGYGRIDVNKAVNAILDDGFMEGSIPEILGSKSYYITIPQNTPELKVTLAWDDVPSTPFVALGLINNLDLVLIDSNGVQHNPWILNPYSPSTPATTGYDFRNNVEQVYVANPIAGTWRIRVSGYPVVMPPQPYSLVSEFLNRGSGTGAPGGMTRNIIWNDNRQNGTHSIAFGDVDNDGDLDLAVGYEDFNSFVYENVNGALTLNRLWDSNVTRNTKDVVWCDFDRDGDLDLAMGNYGSNNVAYENVNGRLTGNIIWDDNRLDNTNEIACGDVDNDGDLDLAVANVDSNNFIYENVNGVLTRNVVWNDGQYYNSRDLAFGDVDLDGDLDLVVANYGPPSIVYNNVDGKIAPVTATASATYNNQFLPNNAVDGVTDESNQWGYWLLPNATKGWVQIDLGTPQPIKKIRWLNVHNATSNDRATLDYNLFGSLDGNALTAITIGTMAFTPTPVFQEYILPSAANYRYIRFYVRSYYGNGGGLNELEVYDADGKKLTNNVLWVSPAAGWNAGTFGDVDNDGDLDLALADWGTSAKVYRNVSGALTNNIAGNTNTPYVTDISFGDADNDGDLDMAVARSGYCNKAFVVCLGYAFFNNGIYKNTGGYITDKNIWLDGRIDASYAVEFADVDRDGDLDIGVANTQMCGAWEIPCYHYGNDLVFKNSESESGNPNFVPSAPANFSVSHDGTYLNLGWSGATDNETPASGLHYNVRVGTTPNGNDILSGKRAWNGSNFYNNGPQQNWLKLKVPNQNYYWCVETIDSTLAGSGCDEIPILPGNTAPAISGLPDQSMIEDSGLNDGLIDLWAYASDAETPDENLQFSILSESNPLVVQCAIESGRNIGCVTKPNQFGYSDVTIQVSDTVLTASDTFRIDVQPVNDAPVIAGLPSVALDTGSGFNDNVIDLWDYAFDAETDDNQLGFGIASETNLAVVDCDVDSNRYIDCTVQLGQNGYSDVNVLVSDGELTDTDLFRVSVSVVNEPPVISFSPLTDPVITEEQQQLFEVSATDPDGDAMDVNWYVGAQYVGSGWGYTYSADYGSAGKRYVTAVVSDGNYTAPKEWLLTVTNVNRPPIVSGIPDVNFSEDGNYLGLDLDNNYAYDPDGDAITRWYYSGNTYVNVAIAANNAVTFIAEPDWFGSETITFTATDGDLNGSDSIAVTVLPVNDAPRAAVSEPNAPRLVFNYDRNGSIPIRFIASDADNNYLAADIYYSPTKGAFSNLIVADLDVNAFVPDYRDENLRGYWRFDQEDLNASNWVRDLGPNHNNGLLYGNTALTQSGKLRQALVFDGSGDYVDYGNGVSLEANLPVTISAWIKTNAGSKWMPIAATDTTAGQYYGVWFDVSSTNMLGVSFGDGTGVGSGDRRSKGGVTALEVGRWYHVAAVVRGAGNMTLYLNGVDDGGSYSGTGGPIAYSTSPAKVGFDGVNYFDGTIDEVAIWNRALTADEIRKHYYNASYDFNIHPSLVSDGLYFIDINISDGTTSATASGDYNFLINNIPPIVSGIPDVAFPEDGTNKSIDLDNYVSDATGAGDYIRWSYSGNTNVFVSIDSNKVVTFSAAKDWYGSELITFTARDSADSNGSDSITVTVLPVNSAPRAAVSLPNEPGLVFNYDRNGYVPIRFIASDADNNYLTTSIYYSPTKGAFTNLIVANLDTNAFVPDYRDENLSGYWQFDSGDLNASNWIRDLTPKHNHGLLYGNTTLTQNGKLGQALVFDGSGDYVGVPNSPSLNTANQLTIETWIKRYTNDNSEEIVGNGGGWTASGYDLISLASGVIRFELQNTAAGKKVYFDSSVISNNTWHYVVATYDGNLMKIYIDGTLNASNGAYSGTTIGTTTASLGIGYGLYPSYGGSYFNGVIDEAAVWNKALTAGVIRKHYYNAVYDFNIHPSLVNDGLYFIDINASDGAASATASSDYNFLINNIPPIVSDIPDVTFPEDSTDNSIDLDNYISDATGAGDYIRWSYSGNANVYVSIDSNKVVTFSAAKDWYGSEQITFTARDSADLNDSDGVNVTVTPAGDVTVAVLYPNETGLVFGYGISPRREIQITTDNKTQSGVAIYGSRIAWTDYRDGNADIYMYDTSAKTETRITTDPANQYNPAIHGNKIVWYDYRNVNADIYLYDLSSGVETRITTNSADQIAPAIDGNRIVWQDYRDGNTNIYMYDLSTGLESQITTNNANQYSPSIGGDKIVWYDNRNINYDIYMYDLNTLTETRITTNTATQYSPKIHGNRIVWYDYRDGNTNIYMYDLTTSAETRITADAASQTSPTIYGDKIVWRDNRNGNWDIYEYDLNTQTEKRLTFDTSDHSTPAIYERDAVWPADHQGNWDIYYFGADGNLTVYFNTYYSAYSDLNASLWYSPSKYGYENLITDNILLAYADKNTVGYWRLDRRDLNASNWIKDATANRNDGQLYGNAAINPNGKLQQALSFDGSGDYVRIPDSASLRPAKFTLEAWVWLAALQSAWSAYGAWVISKEYNLTGYGLVVGGMEPGLYICNTSACNRLESNVDIGLNQWHHIAATYDGTTARIYVDGELKNSGNFGFANGSAAVGIGSWNADSPSRFFNGRADEVAIWSRGLTSAEIRDHYLLRHSASYDLNIHKSLVADGNYFIDVNAVNVSDATDTATDSSDNNFQIMNHHPPVFSTLPTLTMAEDDPDGIPDAFDFDDYTFDADGDTLSYTVLSQTCDALINGGGIDSDNNADVGPPFPDAYGSCNANIQVSDGNLTDTALVTIVVTPVNDRPVVYDIPDIIMGEDTFTDIDLDDYVDDIDNNKYSEIVWTYSGGPNLFVYINSNSHIATIASADGTWCGTDTITFIATDMNGESDSNETTVTVNCVNDQPFVFIVLPFPGESYSDQNLIEFSGFAWDEEDGPLLGEWTSDIDGIIGAGDSFATTLSGGMHTITLSATDSNGAQGTSSIILYVCGTPRDDFHVNNDVALCAGSYYAADANNDGAIIIEGSNLTLDCANANIYGDGTGKGIVVTGDVPAEWFTDGNIEGLLDGNKIMNDEQGFESSTVFKTGITIGNCDVSGYAIGVLVTGGADIRIENSTLHGNSVAGIGMQGVKDSVVTGNTVYGNSIAGIAIGVSKNSVIEGNEAYDNNGTGIVSTGRANIIRNNNVHGNEKGIHIGGMGMEVSGNSVLDNNPAGDSEGITALFSTGALITGNTVQNSKFGIRLLSSNDVTVEDNNVSDTARGIDIGAWVFTPGDLNKGVFSNNRILNSSEVGMHMTDAVFFGGNNYEIHNLVLQGNYFENPGVFDLEVADNGTSYVYLFGGKARISGGKQIRDMNVSGNSFMGGGVQADANMNLFCVAGAGNTYGAGAQQAPGDCPA